MSFFNSIFGGGQSPKNDMPTFWKVIESMEDYNNAIEISKTNRVAIFKHSTRCFISKTVLQRFEKEVLASDSQVQFYYLDLIKYRSVSNFIADDLNVTHQSPQLIVIENGQAINNASHQNVELSLTK